MRTADRSVESQENPYCTRELFPSEARQLPTRAQKKQAPALL